MDIFGLESSHCKTSEVTRGIKRCLNVFKYHEPFALVCGTSARGSWRLVSNAYTLSSCHCLTSERLILEGNFVATDTRRGNGQDTGNF